MRASRSAVNRLSEALRRVGGPSSVSWFAFWTTLSLNFMHHVTGSPGVTGLWRLRLLAVVVSQLAMFAMLLIARATVLRHVDVQPRPGITVLLFMIAGMIRSLTLWTIVGTATQVPPLLTSAGRLTGALMFAAYLCICSYLVDVYRENRRRMDQAARTQAVLLIARSQAASRLHKQQQDLLDSVHAEVIGQFDALTSDAEALTAHDLQVFLDGTVRPTSHRLAAGIQRWQAPEQHTITTRLDGRRLYDAVGVSRPFAPVLQGALSVIPALSPAIVLTAPRFVVLLVLAGGTPWLMLTIGNGLVARLPVTISPAARLATVLGWCVVTALVVASVWGAVLMGTGLGSAGFDHGIFVTLTLSLAGIAAKAALTTQRRIVHELDAAQKELRWDVARVQQLQWHQQRVAARGLHGTVQSAIILETIRLGSGSESVAEFRARLTTALQEAVAASAAVPSMQELLGALTSTWSGLCDVAARVSADAWAVNADPISRSCLSDLLSDAVANAVRHGRAGTVRIDVGVDSARVLAVSVGDDGCPHAATPGAGMGSQILDDCCVQWERTYDAAGTQLSLLLPFEPDYLPGVGQAGTVAGDHQGALTVPHRL